MIIGLFIYLKVNPRIVQYCLIFGLNIIILLLIVQSFYILYLYWFIFSLLLVSIYQSPILNTILALVTTVESAIVLVFALTWEINLSLTAYMPVFTFSIIFITIIGAMQTLLINNFWQRVEKQNIAKVQELLSKEAYLRLFFEHANDAIAVFDLNNKIIEVNPAFEKLYGWKRAECLGNTVPLVPPKNTDAAQERFIRLLRGESITLLETEDMRKDGTFFDALISLSPIYNRHGEMVAVSVISRDISYIKENEKLVMQSEKLKLAGEIAAGVAHEIRNPMTVISGFFQMISEDDCSPYQDYTNIIKNEIERIDLIMSEFLVLSRPHLDTPTLINISEISNEITDFFKYEFQHRQIEFISNIHPLNIKISGNENQIKQVLINLIKNAIEAIGHNGTIVFEMCIDNHKDLYISITDSGCGIPPHLLDRIFEPFYTTKTKGTGLGMMITNKIIQDHNGTIKIRSKEKVGTEIVMKFPIAQI